MSIVVNDKRWQENSDGWVKAMHASNERKQRKKEMSNLVGYKVEIIFTQDKEKDDPADWILDAVNEGRFLSFMFSNFQTRKRRLAKDKFFKRPFVV